MGPDISIVIAGNKSDLEKQRNVDHDEAVKCVPPHRGARDAKRCSWRSQGVWRLACSLTCASWCAWRGCRYAESVGAKHFLTSAKQNKNLDKVFLELTKGA